MAKFLKIERKDALNTGREKLNDAIDGSEEALNKSTSADQKATQALSNSESTQTQLDTIVIDGDSSVEAAQARVDEKGVPHPTLKARIDDGLNSVNQQLAENTNTNPTFRNDKDDTLNLSEELLTTATVDLGNGWSGSIQDGFTHAKGYADPLIFTLPFVAGETYNVEVNITNPAEVDNGQSDYWFSLAGSPEFETYKGRSGRALWGIKAVSGNQFIVRPWENYGGTISFSVKRVLNEIQPYAKYQDSDNVVSLEMRLSKAHQNSLYVGKNSGRSANEFAVENVVLGDEAGSNLTSGFWNVLLGYGAGREGTTATRNVLIGRHAGRDNITGNRIVAIGSWALMRNKTGENLAAIGADAMYYNIDGSDKIGIGTVAIGGNTGGRYLIGLGDRVMANSEGGEHVFAAGRLTLNYNEGSHNSALGEMAGYQNRAGSHNFYAGNRAGMLNQIGDNIIAIGNEALFNNMAHSNIGFGRRAQYFNKYGIYNVSFGHESGYENEDGSYNVSGGYRTLYKNKGGENVAFGRSAASDLDGTSNFAAVSSALRYFIGDNNIGIGRGAGAREGATGDNNIFVGFNAGTNHLEGDNNILIGFNTRKSLANTSNELNIGDVIKSKDMTTGIIEVQKLKLTNLPTSDPNDMGMLWNDGGSLKVSA